jgi:hypothetical protein
MKYVNTCVCGGELEVIAGGTFDTLPTLYPVKCIVCGKETMSQKVEEIEQLNRSSGELSQEQQKIRNKVNDLYATIRQANADLDAIREKCTHEITFNGEYAWGSIAHTCPAVICSICDKCVRTLFDPPEGVLYIYGKFGEDI